MRNFLTVFLILSCTFLIAQEEDNPSNFLVEFIELPIGDTYVFGDFELKFITVGVDSRCPKNVMCVRAGEVAANVLIYKAGKLISEEKLIFTPGSFTPNTGNGNLFNSEVLKISGVELFSYPMAGEQILKSDYKLKLLIEELVD